MERAAAVLPACLSGGAVDDQEPADPPQDPRSPDFDSRQTATSVRASFWPAPLPGPAASSCIFVSWCRELTIAKKSNRTMK